jgi:hypothetical protein
MVCSDETYELAQAVNGLERTASHSGHLYTKERSIGTYWIGDGMAALKNRKRHLPEIKFQPFSPSELNNQGY